MSASDYDVDMPCMHYWVIALFNWIHYVTLWPWPSISTLESCNVMPLGWSIPMLSLRSIRFTVPELWQLQFSFDRRLKVPIFTCFTGGGVKGVKFQIS